MLHSVARLQMGEAMTHDELRKLAEAATPGPWWQRSALTPEPTEDGATELSELLCFFPDEDHPRFWDWINDGAFVAAANPKTVLELLDRIAELEGALKPFAEAAPYFEPEEQEGQVLDDDHMIADVITCGELRRAAELVKP